MAGLARMRIALERATLRRVHESAGEEEAAEPETLPPILSDGGEPTTLERLCENFGLSEFERDTLLLAVGMELDESFAPLCAAAGGDERRPFPTFGLALAALPGAHWSAFAPSGALRHWRLIEILAGETLMTRRLRADERVLHHAWAPPRSTNGCRVLSNRSARRAPYPSPTARTPSASSSSFRRAMETPASGRSSNCAAMRAGASAHWPPPCAASSACGCTP